MPCSCAVAKWTTAPSSPETSCCGKWGIQPTGSKRISLWRRPSGSPSRFAERRGWSKEDDMKARSLIGVGLVVLVLGVGTVVPGFAGGWAVVTLDSLPEGVVPGVDFTIGFTVRQHGVTLLSDLNPAPVVTAKHTESDEVVRSIAAPEGGPGHYAAQLSLPSSGEWYWGILAFGPEAQSMPPLVVSAARASAASEPASMPTALAVMAAGLAVLGIGLAFRRHFAVSGLAIILAAVLGGMSFAGVDPSPSIAEAAVEGPSVLRSRSIAPLDGMAYNA